MPVSVRFELFPSDIEKFLSFYVDVLRFKLLKQGGNYVYVNRDAVFIGAVEHANEDSLAVKQSYRAPPKGIEIVIEVDDLVAERDAIVAQRWELVNDIALQPWGLEDFRLVDPDGYYLRITTSNRNSSNGL